MDIRIKTTNYTMMPEISNYLDKKLNHIEKLFDESREEARCEVEVGRAAGHPERGNIWRAEINLKHKGQVFRSETTAETVNAAIDGVKDEITHQMRRDRKLHMRLVRRGGAIIKRMIRFGRE